MAQISGLASGTVWPVGATTNTYVVTDADGQVLTQAVEVTIAFFIPQILILPLTENEWLLVGHESALRSSVITIAAFDYGLGIPIKFEFVGVLVKLGSQCNLRV